MNVPGFTRARAAACIAVYCGTALQAQTSDSRPRFEVTSVKANLSGCPQGRGGGAMPQNGRLHVTCIAVQDLIQAAYGTFANPQAPNPLKLQITGAPDWVDTDLFDLDAKPAGNATVAEIYGPLMQTLLEDRFGLRIHREKRELPVYLLTVDAGGAKLHPTAPGACVQFDASHPPPQQQQGQPPIALCGRGSLRREGATLTTDGFGTTMAKFANGLTSLAGLDRPVIDRTELDGMFDIHLAFSPDLAASDQDGGTAPNDNAGPSIFTALKELGLKLSKGRAPVEVLVIDQIKHPDTN